MGDEEVGVKELRFVLELARVHIGNGDPRCAEFGDWSRDGWTNADREGRRCDECAGCSGVMIEQWAGIVLEAQTIDEMNRRLVEVGIYKEPLPDAS